MHPSFKSSSDNTLIRFSGVSIHCLKGLLGSFQSPTKYMKPICIGFFGEAEDHEDLKKQLEDGDLIRGTITAEHQGSVDVPFSDKGFCPFQGQAGTRMNPAPVLRIKKQSSFASKACVCDCDSLSLPRCTWLHFSL
ncbi:hypothetical protein Bca4012_051126 [Brassica carinata]